MNKLLYILMLMLSNLLLLGSEQDRVYTKNTCHRTYMGRSLQTDKEREECGECAFSRLEVYDTVAQKYIAHIAYNSSECHIAYLLVDEEYRKKGIGAELAHRAIEDMRANHNCREIDLISAYSAEKFWEKLGAEKRCDCIYAFSDPSSNSKYLNN